MSELALGRGPVVSTRKYYMIYIVLDASESMRCDLTTGAPLPGPAPEGTPLGTFVELIPKMLRELGRNAIINKIASVSIVAFADKAEVLRPMSTLERPAGIPEPEMGFETNYQAVLRFLGDNYEHDRRSVRMQRQNSTFRTDVARPLIFFITDGVPYANGERQSLPNWLPERDVLVRPPIEARIAAIGWPRCEGPVLWHLATGGPTERNAFIVNSSSDATALVATTVEAIKNSISASVPRGEMVIAEPQGMRRVPPVTNV